MKNYPSKYKDLFTYRRKEKKIDLYILKSNREVALAGIYSGSIFILLVTFISGFIYAKSLFLQNKNYRLQPFVESYDEIKLSINKIKKKNKLIKSKNIQLSEDLLKIRSASAILSEIRIISPEYISLYSLILKDKELEVKGTVNQNNGLENINLFILEINRSQFFEADKTSLVQIKIDESSGKNKDVRLNFTLKASIVKDFININQEKLDYLGSEGLSKRVKLTVERGLYK